MTIAPELHAVNQLTKSALLVRTSSYRRTRPWTKRLFWHTYAYTTIFLIMVLTGLSIVLLWGHEAVRQLLRTANRAANAVR